MTRYLDSVYPAMVPVLREAARQVILANEQVEGVMRRGNHREQGTEFWNDYIVFTDKRNTLSKELYTLCQRNSGFYDEVLREVGEEMGYFPSDNVEFYLTNQTK